MSAIYTFDKDAIEMNKIIRGRDKLIELSSEIPAWIQPYQDRLLETYPRLTLNVIKERPASIDQGYNAYTLEIANGGVAIRMPYIAGSGIRHYPTIACAIHALLVDAQCVMPFVGDEPGFLNEFGYLDGTQESLKEGQRVYQASLGSVRHINCLVGIGQLSTLEQLFENY